MPTINQSHGEFQVEPNHPPAVLVEASTSLDALERFARTFEASARRWELVVYPSLFAFVILAAYGFFLIYSLASDVAVLARSVDTQMGENMASMSSNIKNLSLNIDRMAVNLNAMSKNMDTMTGDLHVMVAQMGNIAQDTHHMAPMSEQMTGMRQSVHQMANTMPYMQRDMSVMNQSISRPLSFMNSFMPW